MSLRGFLAAGISLLAVGPTLHAGDEALPIATEAAPQVEPVLLQRLSLATVSHNTERDAGWPTVGQLEGGRLMLVYSGNREAHVDPYGRVEMMHSDDDGETWSQPVVLWDFPDVDDRDAGIIQLQNGDILVNWFTNQAWPFHFDREREQIDAAIGAGTAFESRATGKWDDPRRVEEWEAAMERLPEGFDEPLGIRCWMVRSTDGGETWSEAWEVPIDSPHGPFQTGEDRLLFPGKTRPEGMPAVFESFDNGGTWELLAEIPAAEGDDPTAYHELHGIEAADGTLIVQIRDHNTRPRETLQTMSHDGGRTWSDPESIGVLGFPSHLLRLHDDTLLMTYADRTPPRAVYARLSHDNGATWSGHFPVEDTVATWDFGYPSTVQLEEDKFLTVWYETLDDYTPSVLRQATWRLRTPAE